jgi:hypothetical protein
VRKTGRDNNAHGTGRLRKLRVRSLHVPRNIRDTTGLDGNQVKRRMEQIGALRQALENAGLKREPTIASSS